MTSFQKQLEPTKMIQPHMNYPVIHSKIVNEGFSEY